MKAKVKEYQNKKNLSTRELIENRLLRPREVAEYLSISLNKVYRLLQRPDFPKLAIGRNLRVDPIRLREWLDRNNDGWTA